METLSLNDTINAKDEFHGYGELTRTYKTGKMIKSVYKGNFKNDAYDGLGHIVLYINEENFNVIDIKGNFKNDAPHGKIVQKMMLHNFVNMEINKEV